MSLKRCRKLMDGEESYTLRDLTVTNTLTAENMSSANLSLDTVSTVTNTNDNGLGVSSTTSELLVAGVPAVTASAASVVVDSPLIAADPIELTQGAAPGVTTDKLYNVSGDLYWDDQPLTQSGTYTATLLAIDNVSSLTFSNAKYFRVGNIVTVFVSGEVTPISSANLTEFSISLPFARPSGNFTGVTQATGHASILSTPQSRVGLVGSLTGSQKLNVLYFSETNGAENFTMSATYTT